MDTEDLDFGEFWLLPHADSKLAVSATVVLVLLGVGYLCLVVLMVFTDKLLSKLWYRHETVITLNCKTTQRGSLSHSTMIEAKIRPIGKKIQQAGAVGAHNNTASRGLSWRRLMHEVTSPNGLVRHYYNPVLDLPKLIFQTTTLLTYLHNGFPIAVTSIYTCALFVNWMISSYRYKRERPDPHLIASRIFYSFDLFFAVFAPLEVLVYAKYSFNFERKEFATRAATLSPGSFDRTARLFADPREVAMFRIAFHYLQFTTTGSLLIKSALNLLSIFKWWRTIIHLVEHARSAPKPRASIVDIVPSDREAHTVGQRRTKFLQSLLIAALFFCAGAAVSVYLIVAVVSSQHACKPHPQCRVPSYQWNVGAEFCSCIVFVDRDTQLTTIAEWENPPDTSANLAALAATGHLRIVQIINREVSTLPAQLRQCHNLEQLIMIYTKTRSIPDWAKDFSHLEYLHIEGDQTAKQLTYMPRDLFANMPHLLVVHLGCLVSLPYIPDLDHLDHLEYLVLALLHSVTTIPSLDNLSNLQRLHIIDVIQVYELPSVRRLAKLKTFSLTARDPVCCNGFITGTCDLTDFSCRNRTASGEQLVQCTTARITAADYERLVSTEGEVCEQGLAFDLKDMAPTYATVDGACGGVMYKECKLNGMTGICYPGRFQPIQCQVKPEFQAMRRLQIETGVGNRCDPTVEAWLGCKK